MTATRLGATDGEPLRWREIEVEAKSPDAGRSLLEAAGRLLLDAGARRSSSASKLAACSARLMAS